MVDLSIVTLVYQAGYLDWRSQPPWGSGASGPDLTSGLHDHLLWNAVRPLRPGPLLKIGRALSWKKNCIIGVTSMDWIKGKFTGKPHIQWENLWFPVNFPLIQSIGVTVIFANKRGKKYAMQHCNHYKGSTPRSIPTSDFFNHHRSSIAGFANPPHPPSQLVYVTLCG